MYSVKYGHFTLSTYVLQFISAIHTPWFGCVNLQSGGEDFPNIICNFAAEVILYVCTCTCVVCVLCFAEVLRILSVYWQSNEASDTFRHTQTHFLSLSSLLMMSNSYSVATGKVVRMAVLSQDCG